MSFFMFLIEFPGFIFRPPVSKVTPFPMITNGWSFLEIFVLLTSITIGLDSDALPTAFVNGNFFKSSFLE